MAVDSKHPEYIQYVGLWEKVRDCVDGEYAVKAKGEAYLPRPAGKIGTKYDKAYARYLARARFSNFTGRTAEGLHGGVFSRTSEQSEGISESFAELLRNVDNAGTSIGKFARELSWDTLLTGWGGILVDYSRLPEGVDMATANRMGLTAYLKWYKAENVANWRYDTVDERRMLSLVVLRETFGDTAEDEFAPTVKTRYRVLRLADGVYTQQEYTPTKNRHGKEELMPGPLMTPRMGGEPFSFIPFFPCPAPEPEKSMLLDLAHENIGHYQKSADLENALHISASPTGYVSVETSSDIPMEDDDNGKRTNRPKTIPLGGETMLWLANGGRVAFAEPSGRGLSAMQNGMDASEERMKVLGAKPFDGGPRGVESGKAASIHASAANSVLGAFAVNMGDVITNAVRLGAMWRGVPETEVGAWEFRLNTCYDGDLAKVEEKRLALEMVDDGVMSKVRFLMEYMDLTEEEAVTEVRRIREEAGYPEE